MYIYVVCEAVLRHTEVHQYHVTVLSLLKSYTVFALTSALISVPPVIPQLIELVFLNTPVFKASFYHVSLLRYLHFKF